MTTKTLYESDYAAWADENAGLLRSRRFEDADIEHIMEELEALARKEHHSLERCIVTVIEHKLKLRLNQGSILERNKSKWKRTVLLRQEVVQDVLEDSPSLKGDLTPDMLVRAYRKAVQRFQVEQFAGALPVPRECPFTWEEILGQGEGK